MRNTGESQIKNSFWSLDEFLSFLDQADRQDFSTYTDKWKRQTALLLHGLYTKLSPESQKLCIRRYKEILDKIWAEVPETIVELVKNHVTRLTRNNLFASKRNFEDLKKYLDSPEANEWNELKMIHFFSSSKELKRQIKSGAVKNYLSYAFS